MNDANNKNKLIFDDITSKNMISWQNHDSFIFLIEICPLSNITESTDGKPTAITFTPKEQPNPQFGWEITTKSGEAEIALAGVADFGYDRGKVRFL